jgi:hypothetical protein
MRTVRGSALLAVLCLAALAPTSAAAAGPPYIIVSGNGLAQPVLLDDQAANGILTDATQTGARGQVQRRDDRPHYDLALYWTVPPLNGKSPRDLTPDQASQKGRFYPAVGNLAAVIELEAVPGLSPAVAAVVPDAGLNYLGARGVPIVSDVVLADATPTPTPNFGGGVPTLPAVTAKSDSGHDKRRIESLLWLGVGLSAAAVVGGTVAWYQSSRSRRRW